MAGRKITLELTPEARSLIAEPGYDPSFGARPLKRIIQQKLENPLAQKILSAKIHDGDKVTVSATGKSFTFEVEK